MGQPTSIVGRAVRWLYPGLAALVDGAAQMEAARRLLEQDFKLTGDQVARLEADADRHFRTHSTRAPMTVVLNAALVAYRRTGSLPPMPRTMVEKNDVARAHSRRRFQVLVLKMSDLVERVLGWATGVRRWR